MIVIEERGLLFLVEPGDCGSVEPHGFLRVVVGACLTTAGEPALWNAVGGAGIGHAVRMNNRRNEILEILYLLHEVEIGFDGEHVFPCEPVLPSTLDWRAPRKDERWSWK